MVYHLSLLEGQHTLDSSGYKGMGTTMQHDDFPYEHVETLSFDDSTQVSEGSTLALGIGGHVRVLECKH
jgi:hypothetical protein